jgi:UDP-GlcNAc3NAcA epimerase
LLTIVSIVGARPQFIKAAPLSAAFKDVSGIREVGIHTGQHFDDNMSDIFYRELGVPPPSHKLDIHGGPHGQMTGRMLEAIEQVLLKVRPDAVLVYGDTNSTLAGALAAAKLAIPTIHVEAGLRSHNRRMPEEINRVMADHLSEVLLCPTVKSVTNLAEEGITRNVHHVGDVMYDITLKMIPVALRDSTILGRLGLARGKYSVATVHRAENTDNPASLRKVFDYLADHARERPLVLPLHPRTRAAAAAQAIDLNLPGFIVVEPLGYLDMTKLLNGAALVLTDSGGIQKEAYFHRTPCVTLRSETEWVETITHGWNRLWSETQYRPRADIADYGNGNSAMLMAQLIRSAF